MYLKFGDAGCGMIGDQNPLPPNGPPPAAVTTENEAVDAENFMTANVFHVVPVMNVFATNQSFEIVTADFDVPIVDADHLG